MENNKIEVARSFSRKVNLGNYETCDFFCSAKQEVSMDQFEITSEFLNRICEEQVNLSIVLFQKEKDAKLNSRSINLEKSEKSNDIGLDLE